MYSENSVEKKARVQIPHQRRKAGSPRLQRRSLRAPSLHDLAFTAYKLSMFRFKQDMIRFDQINLFIFNRIAQALPPVSIRAGRSRPSLARQNTTSSRKPSVEFLTFGNLANTAHSTRLCWGYLRNPSPLPEESRACWRRLVTRHTTGAWSPNPIVYGNSHDRMANLNRTCRHPSRRRTAMHRTKRYCVKGRNLQLGWTEKFARAYVDTRQRRAHGHLRSSSETLSGHWGAIL